MVALEAGLQVRSPVTTTHADILLAKNLGCKWWFMPADMSGIAGGASMGSPTSGWTYTYGGFQSNFTYAKSIGLKVMISPTFQPTWLGTYHQIPQDGTHRNAWLAMMTKLVTDFVTADAWQIWNEPNHGPFNLNPSMATIRPFMQQSVLYMRAAGGQMIMCGGPASASTKSTERSTKWDTGTGTSPDSISGATYLDGLYEAGGIVSGTTSGTPYVDAIAIHGYTGAGSPMDVTVNKGNYFMQAFDNIPNIGDPAVFGSAGFNFHDHILVLRGDGGKKIWQTEAGLFGGHSSLDEGTAKNYLLQTLARWRDKQVAGVAGPYIYFELNDFAAHTTTATTRPAPWPPTLTAPSDTEAYLGLYWKNSNNVLTPKLQLDAFTALTIDTITPPPPPPPPPPPADCGTNPWGSTLTRWGDTRVDWAGNLICDNTPAPTIDAGCLISVTVEAPWTSIVMDSVSPDVNGNVWTWTKLDGYWEPPDPAYDTIVLGRDLGEIVTNARWNPRTITLRAVVNTTAGDISKARDTITQLANLLITEGRLIVYDTADPRYAPILLADTPRHNVIVENQLLEVELPFVAYDVFRYLVSSGAGTV